MSTGTTIRATIDRKKFVAVLELLALLPQSESDEESTELGGVRLMYAKTNPDLGGCIDLQFELSLSDITEDSNERCWGGFCRLLCVLLPSGIGEKDPTLRTFTTLEQFLEVDSVLDKLPPSERRILGEDGHLVRLLTFEYNPEKFTGGVKVILELNIKFLQDDFVPLKKILTLLI